MYKKAAKFELVQTDLGWHARFVGGNGEIVWWTEPYPDRRDAVHAVELLAANTEKMRLAFVLDVDESTH